jgi:hypothetical protein
MMEVSIDFIIGINIGITIGYWGCWFLFVREKKNTDLLKVPDEPKKKK